jgi:hypothetical protein
VVQQQVGCWGGKTTDVVGPLNLRNRLEAGCMEYRMLVGLPRPLKADPLESERLE